MKKVSNNKNSKNTQPSKKIVKPIELEVKNNKKHRKIKRKSLIKANKFILGMTIFLSITLLIMSICLIVSIVNIQKDKPTIVNNKPTNIVSENNGIYKVWKSNNNELFAFYSDMSFIYYPDDIDDNEQYYRGEYTYINGLDAIYEMGYSEEEFIVSFGDIAYDNVYSMKLRPSISYLNDKEKTLENVEWWVILIKMDDSNIFIYNKTLDEKYELTERVL